jgi:hypothetical protein
MEIHKALRSTIFGFRKKTCSTKMCNNVTAFFGNSLLPEIARKVTFKEDTSLARTSLMCIVLCYGKGQACFHNSATF